MRPRANYSFWSNLRAGVRQLAALCRRPTRPRPRRLAPTPLCRGYPARALWPPIRTAMLSYKQHGKLPTPTQGFPLWRVVRRRELSPRALPSAWFCAVQVDHAQRMHARRAPALQLLAGTGSSRSSLRCRQRQHMKPGYTDGEAVHRGDGVVERICIATHLVATCEANVKSKAPQAFIFASGPRATFA